jgi:hypothetical protein
MSENKTEPNENSSEQVSPEEALERMRSFAGRKEKFVAAIKESTDRDIPAAERQE